MKMKKNFDNLYEKLGGTYREENGRLYPNLELPEQTNYNIGKYGLLHLVFIKAHCKGRYTTILSERSERAYGIYGSTPRWPAQNDDR